MTVTTNERGQQNVFAKEPQMKVMEVSVTHNERAEQLNGRLAMLGVIAAIGAYAVYNRPAHSRSSGDWNNGFYSGPTIQLIRIRW